MTIFYVTIMPNLDPWINPQNEVTNKFVNHLLSIRDERQKMIRPNCHPTYNERHEKIIELIDWTLEKYRANMENAQQNEEQLIIDDIIKQLDKKRKIAIHKKRQALLKDEVSMYRLEEDTIDYVLFRIREMTGKLV
jgi:phosphoglycerate-specific signal transduction histidine kinase